MNINSLITVNPKDSEYVAGCKEIIEEELYNYWIASSPYEKQFILSVIYKNIQLLKDVA